MARLNIPIPSKGIAVDRPAEYIDAQSASSILNMEVDRFVLRKRNGTESVGDGLEERIMRYFELQVGATTRLLRVGPTKVEALNKTTDEWGSVTETALTGSSNDVVSVAFPLLNGAKIAVYTNGIDDIRKIGITGDDDDLGGSPPKCRYLQDFGPYLVLAYVIDGGTTYYNRVQWCDTGAPETWSGGNASSVNLLADAGDITGLSVFGNYLCVHKETSIYLGQLVTTSAVFLFDRKSTGVGTVANATIVNIPSGEQIFLAADGLHVFNGVTAPLINSPAQEELRTTINKAQIHKSCAMYLPEIDEYWVAVPVGGQEEPETVFRYNIRTGQMYKDFRRNLTALSLYINTSELTWGDMTLPWESVTGRWNSTATTGLTPTPIFGDLQGNSTRRSLTVTDDEGETVSAHIETKDFTIQDIGGVDIDTIIRWRGIEVWAKGNSLTVSYSIDSGVTWISAGTHALSSDYPSDFSPLKVYFDALGSKLRLRFSVSEAGNNFDLKKYQIDAVPREKRK